MEPWETSFWYRSTLISYGAAFLFMVSDTILGPEDVKPMHNVVILFIFTNLLSLALHIHVQKTTPGSANLPNPISPALVNFSKPQGVIFGWIVLFLQQHRVPVGPYLFGALISGVITAFCAVMLLRPVVTDMGIMYTLCSISIGVSVRDHQLNQPTWITFGFCCFLVYARTYLEHRATVAAEEVVAAAERQAAAEEAIAAAERQAAAEEAIAAAESQAAAERQAAEKVVAAAERQAAEKVVAAAERQAAEKIVVAEEVVAAAEKVVAAVERQAAEKIVAAEKVVAAAERQAAEKIVAAEEVVAAAEKIVAAAERQTAEEVAAAEKGVATGKEAGKEAAVKEIVSAERKEAGKEAAVKEIVSAEKEAAASDGQEIAAV